MNAAGVGPEGEPSGHRAMADAAFQGSNRLVDRSLLIFGVLALLGSLLMSPDPEVLTVFGIEVPVMCAFRAVTGNECLGCGLTRSFAFMGHLQPIEAFQMHKFGPVAWAFLVAQIPYRGWRLWRHHRARSAAPHRG